MNWKPELYIGAFILLLTGTLFGASITISMTHPQMIDFWVIIAVLFILAVSVHRYFSKHYQAKTAESFRTFLDICSQRITKRFPTKSEAQFRIEYLAIALAAFVLGIACASIWELKFWDALGAIGSILAGTGTVGLLWFGWIKANEWMVQHQLKLTIDALQEIERLRFEVNLEIEHLIYTIKSMAECAVVEQKKVVFDKINKLRSNARTVKNFTELDKATLNKTDKIIKIVNSLSFEINKAEIRDLDLNKVNGLRSNLVRIYEGYYNQCYDQLPFKQIKK